MAIKRRGLGRDLNALLGGAAAPAVIDNELQSIAMGHISVSPYQPRKVINQEALEELTQSIRAEGLIQPIVVRALKKTKQYELIAGERRWRACQALGMKEIPAIVRDISDEAAMAMALIENIQREDLNPIEEADALHRLIHEFSLTHQQVAEKVGRSRAGVSNLLRLLGLHEPVKILIGNGDIEMGHARALIPLGHPQQLALAHQIIERGLSVRETERLVKLELEEKAPIKTKPTTRDADIIALERRLHKVLKSKVSIRHQANGRGKMVIEYKNTEQLESILAHIE